MATDKSGAPTTVTRRGTEFAITVDGRTVGTAAFEDRGGQRVFVHTEVDDAFQGRGLATILVGEAIKSTKAAGLGVVAVCPMVAAFLRKHEELDDIVDPSDVRRVYLARHGRTALNTDDRPAREGVGRKAAHRGDLKPAAAQAWRHSGGDRR